MDFNGLPTKFGLKIEFGIQNKNGSHFDHQILRSLFSVIDAAIAMFILL